MYVFLPDDLIQYIFRFLDCISTSNNICCHPFLYYNKQSYWKPHLYPTYLNNIPLCFSIHQTNQSNTCLLCHGEFQCDKIMILCTCTTLRQPFYISYHIDCISHKHTKTLSPIQSKYICPICNSRCIGIRI